MVFWIHSFRTPQQLKTNALLSFETSRSVNPVIQRKSPVRPEFGMCGAELSRATALSNDNIQISISSTACKNFKLGMDN